MNKVLIILLILLGFGCEKKKPDGTKKELVHYMDGENNVHCYREQYTGTDTLSCVYVPPTPVPAPKPTPVVKKPVDSGETGWYK